jgi:hypothetical protein
MCTRCIVTNLGIICMASDTYVIDAGVKRFYFELPFGCGLVVVGERGDPVKEPPPRSPFWRAVDLWQGQGQRMRLDGVCAWADKPPTRTEKRGRRTWAVEWPEWSNRDERYVIRRETNDGP